MTTTREIRRRIRSVQSTAKITNALQLVAASKMRRAQERALAARPYAERMRTVLARLAGLTAETGPDIALHPLLEKREVRETMVVLITPDRGLCGGLIANLQRHAGEIVLSPGGYGALSMLPVGKKGLEYFARYGIGFRGEFTQLGDYPALAETRPISRIVLDDYLSRTVDQVLLVYGAFVNTVQQRPTTVQILPLAPPAAAESVQEVQYLFEPSPVEVLEALLPRYVEMQIHQAVLEAAASEQSARMVAMRNATDAANEIIDDLTLEYNKVRQESITSELLDIVGGAAVLAP